MRERQAGREQGELFNLDIKPVMFVLHGRMYVSLVSSFNKFISVSKNPTKLSCANSVNTCFLTTLPSGRHEESLQ